MRDHHDARADILLGAIDRLRKNWYRQGYGPEQPGVSWDVITAMADAALEIGAEVAVSRSAMRALARHVGLPREEFLGRWNDSRVDVEEIVIALRATARAITTGERRAWLSPAPPSSVA